MIYDIRHVTTYRYETPVSFARCALRLFPADTAFQTLLDHEIEISPRPTRQATRSGAFSERVQVVVVDGPHTELRIEARSRVKVLARPDPDPRRAPAWETLRDVSAQVRTLEAESPAHFLFPTVMTPVLEAFTGYARSCFPAGANAFEAAGALARRIHAEFAYDPAATVVTTPAIRAFAARRGVCQDFAHIMICGLRGLGLPAAYVSGYIRTHPPPGQPRLEGADATHAWVALWCGPDLGWIEFDPTNARLAGLDHVRLAVGRDYADVSPIDGVILGGGDQAVTVAVDVTPEAAAVTGS